MKGWYDHDHDDEDLEGADSEGQWKVGNVMTKLEKVCVTKRMVLCVSMFESKMFVLSIKLNCEW